MIKFDVMNRLSDNVQFTAEIDCECAAPRSLKLGLAAKWAIRADANLRGADLGYAYLCGANLRGENLRGAYLCGAYLCGANLGDANLGDANLEGADLGGAYLCGANLGDANLWDANLRGADLRGANLGGSDLGGANLWGADIGGTNLGGAHGINAHVKFIQIDQYPIAYTAEAMQIGCEMHSIAEWEEFDDRRILEMDGKDALKFWRKYKNWIFQTIELCPAEPTKVESK